MIFEAVLYSHGGLRDGYNVIKADSITAAQEEAKKWGQEKAAKLGLSHYNGTVSLTITIDRIPINYNKE